MRQFSFDPPPTPPPHDSRRFDTLDTTLLVSVRDRPFLTQQNPATCASSVCSSEAQANMVW